MSEIKGFEAVLNDFQQFIKQSLKNKQMKAIINANENAETLASIVRSLLL